MNHFDDFDKALAAQGKSAITRRGYLADVRGYAGWIEQTYGETLDPARITRENVLAYKAQLESTRCKPSTVGCKLVRP